MGGGRRLGFKKYRKGPSEKFQTENPVPTAY